MYSRLQKGKEVVEKSIQLSLAQAEQLMAASLDVERTLNYASNIENDPELIQKISNYKTQLTDSINKIQAGEVKEGYLQSEKIRIEIGILLSQLLQTKFEKDSQLL
ncbi:MAG: hypothetical protein N3A69_17885, partial [Leptospiraceae bacterium]|nr:hypothetical protein [Leptospiraceae bacterium]